MLIQALRYEPDDATCQSCLSQLDEYISAQLAGHDYTAQFPEVALHLDACVDCADTYARLYELHLAEATQQLPQPDQVPAPDLSFLLPEASGPLSPAALQARIKAELLAERLRAAVERVANKISLQFSPDLLPLLQPAPSFSAVRGPAESDRYAEQLFSLEPEAVPQVDLPIQLHVYRDAQQPDMGLVEITVEAEDEDWLAAEAQTVVLMIAGERRETITDPWGVAVFEDVPLDKLAEMRIEVLA